MKLKELEGKKILILGYGIEGAATEKYLKKNISDIQIAVADQKDGSDYLNRQYDFDLVIKTPGIPARKLNVPYTTATNLFFANKGESTVIGVTGTKGKSTTASLLHHIFRKSGIRSELVGNIGKPALTALLKPVTQESVFIYELSSYQLDDIRYSPNIAVIVSIFPDHMNYHLSKTNYYNAKKNIIKYMKNDDYYIYNAKYKLLAEWANQTVAHALAFETDFCPKVSPLIGKHNLDNIHAAVTVCRLFGLSDSQSLTAVYSFKPLPHRLEFLGNLNGISFYDDAISTTPESTIAAIRSIKNIGTIFLGGEDRGYNFKKLVKEIVHSKIINIVLFPKSGERILAELKNLESFHPNIFKTDNMEDAVKFAYRHTEAGQSCVLSCASPSYSLWKNYIEKGNLFKKFVKKYAEKENIQTKKE